MDIELIKTEVVTIRDHIEAAMGSKQAKGAMGKIRDHAKKHGESAFKSVMSELDDVVDGSREWNEGQKDLFRSSALEALKTKLDKELR